MSGSSFRVAVWTCFQKMTGQLCRAPNKVERELMTEWERRTGGELDVVLDGVKETAKWRADRGYRFKYLDQAEDSVRIAIDESLKAAPVVPELGRLAGCVNRVAPGERAETVCSGGLLDGWTEEQKAAVRAVRARNRGEDE